MAEGFLYEGHLRGLRILKQESISKSSRALDSKSQYPELWIHQGWPGIPIGSPDSSFPISNSSQSVDAEAIFYRVDEHGEYGRPAVGKCSTD